MDVQPKNPRAAAIQEPSIPLNELVALFRQSASDPELEDPVRRLAARMCVLTRHLQVLAARQAKLALQDQTQEKQLKELDAHLAGVIEMLGPIVQERNGVEATAEEAPGEAGSTEASAASDESIAATARQAVTPQAPAAPAQRPPRAAQQKAETRRTPPPSPGT